MAEWRFDGIAGKERMDFDAEMGRAVAEVMRKQKATLELNRSLYGCDDPNSVSFTAMDIGAESDAFTIQTLTEVAGRFTRSSPPIVAITVQPRYLRMLETLQSLHEKPSASTPYAPTSPLPFYGVPLYPVEGQIERWRTWSDRDALMAYLKEREPSSTQ